MISACLFSLGALASTTLVHAHPPARHAIRQEANSSDPTVDLGYATYRGVRLDALGVDQYLGMRYAQAPLGDLRFRAPRDPLPESGVQDASAFSPLCLGVGEDPSDPVYSEDCLFVNVFAPSNATAESKLPVWLFIQGGGYANLGEQFFNGTEVVRYSGGNIVFVNFNYRVGALGFLASEGLRQDGDLNAGLQDQRKMLYWVQDHIAKFGGDPAHVVIHGPSAGAGSVEHHLAAYGGEDRGLFVGAVAQSSFWPTQRTVADLAFQYDRFVAEVGCGGGAGNSSSADALALACLRAADLSAIQTANVLRPFPEANNSSDPQVLPLWYWLPATEGSSSSNASQLLVPSNLGAAFAAGRFLAVPLLAGNDADEGTVFASNASTPAEGAAFLAANYPRLDDAQLRGLVDDTYPLAGYAPLPTRAPYFPALAAAYGDATFTCPSNTVAEALYAVAAPVWNYRVNVLDPDNVASGLGVPHVFENAAIFGPGNTGPYAASWDTTNAPIVPVIMSYFISFIRSLDPNPYKAPGAPAWEDWGSLGGGRGRRLKLQTNDTVMEEVPQDQADRCAVWRDLRNSTQQ